MKAVSFTQNLTDFLLNGIDITQVERNKILKDLNNNIECFNINLQEYLPSIKNKYSVNIFNYLRGESNYSNLESAKEIAKELNINGPLFLNEDKSSEDYITTIIDKQDKIMNVYMIDEYGIWCSLFENETDRIYHIYNKENKIISTVQMSKVNSTITYFYKSGLYLNFEDYLTNILEDTLMESDIVFFDWFNIPNQTLLKSSNSATTIGVLHSNYHALTNKLLKSDLDKKYLTNQQLFNLDFDFIEVPTYEQKEYLEKNLHKDFIVIPPKTDYSDRFKSKYEDSEFEENHFVTISSLIPGKNLKELINFISYYNNSYAPINNLKPLRLDIFGAGPQQEELKQLIELNNLNEYVILMGILPYENIDFLKNYEAYLSTSLSESYGITLLEALNAGLPIIGLDVPNANKSIIGNNERGALVPVDESYHFDYVDYLKAIHYTKDNHTKIQENIKTFLEDSIYSKESTKECYNNLLLSMILKLSTILKNEDN